MNLLWENIITFDAEGRRSLRARNIVRILKERGKSEGSVPVSFKRDTEEVQIDHGRTVLPDGSIQGLTDKGVRTSADNARTPEYDRQMTTLITLPAVDIGRVIDWQYTKKTVQADPHLPSYFQQVIHWNEPVVRGILEIRMHKAKSYEIVLTDTKGLARSRRTEGDFLIERFEYSGLEPGPEEGQKPPAGEIFPTLYVAPKISWDQAAAPFQSVLEEAAAVGSQTQSILKQLAVKGKAPEEVYAAVASWVAREIRLVRIGLSSFRFAPRALEDILASRTGNYLDKTFALYGLLRAAGLETELYLNRDRYLGSVPPTIRSLRIFNDAVVRVKRKDWEWHCADSDDLGPLTLDSAFYDTAALRVDSPTPVAGIQAVRAAPLKDDLVLTRYLTELDEKGTLKGARQLFVKGNAATTVRGYRNLSQEKLKRRMERLNQGFHPSSELLGFELKNVDDFTKQVEYRRDFRVPGYALQAGGKLLAFKMPGLVDSAGDVGLPVRHYPLGFLEREVQDLEIEVRLPAGFRVRSLPDGLSFAGKGYSYQGRFEKKENSVRFTGRSRRMAYRLSPEEYPSYKLAREKKARLADQWVVLEKTP